MPRQWGVNLGEVAGTAGQRSKLLTVDLHLGAASRQRGKRTRELATEAEFVL